MTATPEDPRLELRIVNRLAEIERVNEVFNSFARTHGLEEGVRRAVNVVFDELLTNTMSYGYADQEEHFIEISVTLDPRWLRVRLVDDGAPFNPLETEAPDTVMSVEDRPIGGLGVHLVRSIMDAASYKRQGSENVLTLEKQRASSEE